MGGALFLPHCLFDLRHPSTGAYRLLGGTRTWCQNGSLQESSCPWVFPSTSAPVSLSPQWATASLTSPGDPPRPASRSGPGSYEVTAFFPWGPCVHKTLCVPSKSWVSVSPSPVELLRSNPICIQSQMLWGILLLMPDPQAGVPDVGLRTLAPMEKPLWFNYFPVCGLLTQQVWDLIVSQMHPSYCLIVASLSLKVEYLFGRFQVFCWWFSAVSCDFDVFMRRGELKCFYSTILSPLWQI